MVSLDTVQLLTLIVLLVHLHLNGLCTPRATLMHVGQPSCDHAVCMVHAKGSIPICLASETL